MILNSEPEIIQAVEWGLIPFWVKDKGIQNSTLNAKIETLFDKAAFKGGGTSKLFSHRGRIFLNGKDFFSIKSTFYIPLQR